MIKYFFLFVAFASLFLFPYPVTVILTFAATLFFPVAGIILGIIAELLYAPFGASFFPSALMWGMLATILSLFVRRLVKTSIITG